MSLQQIKIIYGYSFEYAERLTNDWLQSARQGGLIKSIDNIVFQPSDGGFYVTITFTPYSI